MAANYRNPADEREFLPEQDRIALERIFRSRSAIELLYRAIRNFLPLPARHKRGARLGVAISPLAFAGPTFFPCV